MKRSDHSTEKDKSNEEKSDIRTDVMISVHVARTLLKKNDGKKKRSSMLRKISLNGKLQTTEIIILAIGTPGQLCIPQSFCYYDPLNCWRSETKFVNSSILRDVIMKRWADFRENKEVPESIAKHILLDRNLEEISLRACGDKVKVKSEDKLSLLQFLSHGPDKTSLDNVLKNSGSFHEDKTQWLATKDPKTFVRIKSSFFDEPNLPTSYKFDTTKLKHKILSRPNQLGAACGSSPGQLHLLYHNEAHMKFTERVSPAKKFDDDSAIKEKLCEGSSAKRRRDQLEGGRSEGGPSIKKSRRSRNKQD